MSDDDPGPLILGHLAHPDRRRVIAAVILGATTVDDVKQATGLSARSAASGLSRLSDAGLLLSDGAGRFWPVDQLFRDAAIRARPARQRREGEDQSARVLRSFVRDGRLLSIPAQRSKRLVVLDLLAQEFEPGRRYRERTVNSMLRRWHDDTAALRRYLVDEGFLDRAGGEYWRSGGSVTV